MSGPKLPLCLVLVIGTSSTTPTAAEHWTQFGGPHRNFQLHRHIGLGETELAPRLRWQRSLGEGLSSLVADKRLLYATYLQPTSNRENSRSESPRSQQEVVVALERATGETLWEYAYDAGWIDEQEAFGGRRRAPQATPALVGNALVTVGFTGMMHCLDSQSGELKWKLNLVDQFNAIPVQFGFASSPLVCDGQLIVLAGGNQGGLVSLDINTGEVRWNVACEEASYATPVLLEADGTRQVVFVTRNEIVGVDLSNGETLWMYELREQGLTNVPTPLPVADGELIVSGQGIGGTEKLAIRHVNGQWDVCQEWSSRTSFFYCNWILRDDLIVGCDGDLLVVLDASTGATLGRWRGYQDANLVAAEDGMLLQDGKGVLSTLRSQPDKLQVLTRHRILEERCWAPPTWVGDDVYCRGGSEVVCVRLAGEGEGRELEALTISRPELMVRRSKDNRAPSEWPPVERIVTAFEREGQEAAWQLYEQLRAEGAETLTIEDRYELAEMARGQGLIESATQILEHAAEDFPEQARALQEHQAPSNNTHRGGNGLLYVELGIRNNTWKMMQTHVAGPEAHPFSYGIPFPPGKVRIEKWPVGTRLYETERGIKTRVLLTVKESDAGKTIALARRDEH